MLTFQGIHEEILHDKTSEIDVEGARMCGKTFLCSAKVLYAARDNPGMWWLINRYSGTETDNQLRPIFRDVARQIDIPLEWKGDESAYHLPQVDGRISKIFAYGLKTQAKDERFAKVRGSGVGGLWNDQSEETPEDIGTEMRALIRQPGVPHQLLLSPNPPGEEHYLADQFPEGIRDALRRYYRLSLYDNKHNLTADTIEKLERLYPRTHAKHKSLILGMRGPNVTGTPVYNDAFQRSYHIGPLAFDRNQPLLEAFHAGQHHPTWLVAQRTPFGGLHLLAGIIGKRLFLEDFLPLVDAYRNEWFAGASKVYTCCDPPPSEDDNLRYTSVNIMREHGLKLRWRDMSTSPDVRESVIQTIAGMMKRRIGQSEGFIISDDPSRWLMTSTAVTKETKLMIDGCEGSYIWDENLVSVGNKKVRQPKVDQWLEGLQRCLENIVLNFFAGQMSEAERHARQRRSREESQGERQQSSQGKARWMV